MSNEVLVSIVCLAYNHEKYIEDALNGMLKQKTNFKYEILIHDDASTDNTANIIRKYESLYPEKIKPIYQKENQYSKGVKISRTYQFTRAKGKYIAVCEGDDFWNDENKLQKQVEYLENHPDCTLCFHAANLIDDNGNMLRELRPYNESRVCTFEDFFEKKVNYPTASLVFRAELSQTPDEYECISVSDIVRAIYCLSNGYGYYMDEIMSSYRTGVPTSWTTAVSKNNKMYLDHLKQLIVFFEAVNKKTNYIYDNVLKKEIKKTNCLLLMKECKFKEAKALYKDEYKKYSIKNKMIYILKYKFNPVYSSLRNIKKVISRGWRYKNKNSV